MKLLKSLCLLATFATFSFAGLAQMKYTDRGVDIVVKGTSNIHDWDVKSDKGIVDATIAMGAGDKTVTFSKLAFVVNAETLKSGKSGMDKNTYKALKTEEHKNINFDLLSANAIPTDGNTYQVKAKGNLTVAGVTKPIDLIVTAKWNNADKSLSISGAKAFNMTEFGVKPPTALFGTIKTGDEVNINFNVQITK